MCSMEILGGNEQCIQSFTYFTRVLQFTISEIFLWRKAANFYNTVSVNEGTAVY